MIFNLWVKNVLNGIVHQVGTNINDSLKLIDGRVEYVNIDTNGGTHDGDYIFVEPPTPDMDVYISVNDFVICSKHIHKTIKKPQSNND